MPTWITSPLSHSNILYNKMVDSRICGVRVYSAAYGTVHYKEPLKSFKIRVGHIPASGFLLSRYCYDCADSDVKGDLSPLR